jgi:hypothetical protein
MSPELERLLEKFPVGEKQEWDVALSEGFHWKVYFYHCDDFEEDSNWYFTMWWGLPFDYPRAHRFIEIDLNAENFEEALEEGWRLVKGLLGSFEVMKRELEAATRAEGPRVSAWERL